MRSRWFRRLGLAAIVLLGLAGAITITGALWLHARLDGSLPLLDGAVALEGLAAPARIERDARGRATIVARSREDLAFATGFAHAQDRFFQMDLSRRRSAGELAALVGAAAVELDRATRAHGLRRVARASLASAPPHHRALIEAYTRGVNAGLAALEAPPFEYAALRVDPEPWLPEDVGLVLLAKFVLLQSSNWRTEDTLGVMHDALPQALFLFLSQQGTTWDAPIVGEPATPLPPPGPDVIDLRTAPAPDAAPKGRPAADAVESVLGSNAWLVAGARSANGGALVANDMHLPIGTPPVWYFASLVQEDDDGRELQRHTGVTLPGAPAMIVGSTGSVAWGFTNSYGDFADLVVIERDPSAPDERYLTPGGPRAFEDATETIAVAHGEPVTITIRRTIWGPVIGRDANDRPLALRWAAHDPEAVNLDLIDLESARTVGDAIAIAQRSGVPAQNFHVADASGRVAWTIMGRIPRRKGFDGRVPQSWADGSRSWDGYLAPGEAPAIVDPQDGLIWTANARVVDGDALRVIGDSGYALGARAAQIRDALRALSSATPQDMLAIQLDDRALFLDRWQKLLLATLDDDAIAADPRRGEARALVEAWGARAAVDSAGYRIVRGFRNQVRRLALDPLFAPCLVAKQGFDWSNLQQIEGPLWTLMSEEPPHLLSPAYESWRALRLQALDRTIAELTAGDRALASRTWGERNVFMAKHPLSLAVPMLSRYLDMPPLSLPGDGQMPRVQGTSFGSSQRLVVSPGRESEGYYHMPGGASGHPLSPFYASEHDDWAEGRSVPFLPGPSRHRLDLQPAR